MPLRFLSYSQLLNIEIVLKIWVAVVLKVFFLNISLQLNLSIT